MALLLSTVACGGAGDRVSEEWSLVLSGLPGALTSIWGANTNDIWVVGGDPGDGSGHTVMHFDGSDWGSVDTGFSGDLWWVFGFPDGPVFMGGENGLILRYESGAFERMATPGTATVFGIWGTAPDNLWAVGGNVISDAFAWRYDGEAWTPARGFPAEVAESESLFKVWGASADDVWLVGTGGTALHYDGGQLTREASGTAGLLFTLHSDSHRYAAVGGLRDGIILENGGSGWVDVTPGEIPRLIGVWLQGDRGYAVGVEGAVFRRDRPDWREVDTGIDVSEAFHAVWIDADGGVWAVGGQVLAPPLVDGVMIYLSPPADSG